MEPSSEDNNYLLQLKNFMEANGVGHNQGMSPMVVEKGIDPSIEDLEDDEWVASSHLRQGPSLVTAWI